MTMSPNTRVNRELTLNQLVRFHENEARIIESWLTHPKEVAKEIAELEKRIADLSGQLAAMREREAGLSRELLEEHRAKAKAAKRDLAMLTSNEQLAEVAELMKKLKASGFSPEELKAMVPQ